VIYTSFAHLNFEFACRFGTLKFPGKNKIKLNLHPKIAVQIIFKEGKVPYSLLLRKARLEIDFQKII